MWHYQVIQYPKRVEIVEFFYVYGVRLLKSGELREDKKPSLLYTEHMLTDKYESIEEMERELKLMLKDIKKYKTFNYKKLPKPKNGKKKKPHTREA